MFSDLPNDCLWLILEKLMRTSGETCLMLAVNFKFSREMIREILVKTKKWDDIMVRKGKVMLDLIEVAWTYPELKQRVMNYVKGKTKFIYKTTFFQFDKPKQIEFLHIKTAKNQFEIKWSGDGYKKNDMSCGCSVKISKGDNTIPIKTFEYHPWTAERLPYRKNLLLKEDEIIQGMRMLNVLKSEYSNRRMYDEVMETLDILRDCNRMNLPDRCYQWGVKHPLGWGGWRFDDRFEGNPESYITYAYNDND